MTAFTLFLCLFCQVLVVAGNLLLKHAMAGIDGQDRSRLQTGSWLFADLDSSILFDTPLGDRWERALGLLGLTRETVWMKPVDE